MKLRSVTFISVLFVAACSLVLSATPATTASSIRAATGPAASWHSSQALTHTVRLPLILNCSPRVGPDPYFSYQYDMSIINADDAWSPCDVYAGNVTIAIIDTGVDLDHPDLQANLIAGYDYVSNDAVPEDGNGHGTNVAGIAAAALNGVGVAGVAPTAKVLPVRVLSGDGSGSDSSVAAGIIYAADRAQVLNLSLGGPASSRVMLDAINYAVNKGRLVIAAAGNCGSNYNNLGCNYTQHQPMYPAAYSNVMAVAATTSSDTRASFSNVGSYVDIAAPGVSIFSTYYGNSYASESGTSQATPHVAGLAALVWAKHPGYTAAQVWNQMTLTAVDLGAAGVDTSFGAGRIDVKQALGLTTLQVNSSEVKLAKAALPVVGQPTASIAPGRIVVKFKDAVGLNALATALDELSGAEVDKTIPAINALVLSVPTGSEWEMIDQLRTQSEVEYAEPDYFVRVIR